MVNSAVRSGLALPIDVPGSAGPSRRALSSTPGDRTVSEAFADTLKARTRASSAGRSVISTPSQETGAGASNVQNPVTASTSSGVSGWSIFGGNTGANAASKPTGASAAATPAASSSASRLLFGGAGVAGLLPLVLFPHSFRQQWVTLYGAAARGGFPAGAIASSANSARPAQRLPQRPMPSAIATASDWYAARLKRQRAPPPR